MNGNLDSYLQMRVNLSDEEVRVLEERRELRGRITLSSPTEPWREAEVKIYLIDRERPRDDELRPLPERGVYELYLCKEELEHIKQQKIRGAVSPRKWLRSVSISLVGVTA